MDDNIINNNVVFDAVINISSTLEIPHATVQTFIDNITEVVNNIDVVNNLKINKQITQKNINQLESYKKIKINDKLLGCDCVICQDKYVIGEYKRTLPCKHIFHKKCVDKWFKKHNTECPLCRDEVFKKTLEYS